MRISWKSAIHGTASRLASALFPVARALVRLALPVWGGGQMRLKLGRDDDPHPENAIDKLEIRHFRDPHVLGLPRAGADNPPAGIVDSHFGLLWGRSSGRFA